MKLDKKRYTKQTTREVESSDGVFGQKANAEYSVSDPINH